MRTKAICRAAAEIVFSPDLMEDVKTKIEAAMKICRDFAKESEEA